MFDYNFVAWCNKILPNLHSWFEGGWELSLIFQGLWVGLVFGSELGALVGLYSFGATSFPHYWYNTIKRAYRTQSTYSSLFYYLHTLEKILLFTRIIWSTINDNRELTTGSPWNWAIDIKYYQILRWKSFMNIFIL